MKITPGVVELPLRVTFVLMQVSVPPSAEALGAVAVQITCAEAEAVQPLVVLVTVRVYVPHWFTVGARVVWPETMLPLLVVQA